MTGVTGLDQLAAAEPALRPSYVAADLGGLGRRHDEPTTDGDTVSAGGWSATVVDGAVQVSGDGDGPDAWWQVVATAAWRHLDTTGDVADVSGLTPPSSVAAEPAAG